MKDTLENLYREKFGEMPGHISSIAGAGSNRRYFRINGAKGSAIGVVGTSRRENENFIRLDRFFSGGGIRVPEIYAVAPDGLEYLQEDLGNTDIFSMLRSPLAAGLIRECMKSLARLQTLPGAVDLASECCRPFGKRAVMWDLNYFKYCFLKNVYVEFDEDALENDFLCLAENMCDVPEGLWGLMYRDCQSRNVMVKDGVPYWIDFQGARPGPCAYDCASFLWQAKADFDGDFRREMTEVYAAEYSALTGVNAKMVTDQVHKMVLLRTLQVLGAYGFRGLVEKKSHFIESIRYGLKNLDSCLADGMINGYPELERVCRELVKSRRFDSAGGTDSLTVTIFSFSYKKGYPEDLSGNGGGFMFDCRGMHNPGRYEQFKPLTGLDAPVMDFLEERGEVQEFLRDLYGPVSRTIDCYIRRGFASLQVGFGCTGGRHRSVYCAEHLAERIAKEYHDVHVHLIHREQGIERHLNYTSE